MYAKFRGSTEEGQMGGKLRGGSGGRNQGRASQRKILGGFRGMGGNLLRGRNGWRVRTLKGGMK